MEARKLHINLDLDGVIADFDKRVVSILGRSLTSYPDSQSGWDALGDYKYQMYILLEPMPDAHILVDGVYALADQYGCTVGTLTALPQKGRVPLAEPHKKEWLSRRFPRMLENFKIGPHAVDKQNHCEVGDVLIDDSKLNIPQWNAKGGKGILHTDAETSLAELRKYLQERFGK